MRALVLLLVVLVGTAIAQTPPYKQRTQTASGLWKCGRDYSSPFENCVNPSMDRIQACLPKTGTFAARPAASACPLGLYIVTNCLTTDCTAGGGSITCPTIANSGGTAWTTLSGLCGSGGSGADTGYTLAASCTDGSSDNGGAINTQITTLNGAGGGTLVIPSGKTCGVGTQIALKSNVNIRCEGGAGFKGRSGVGASGLLANSTTLDNVKITGCTFNGNALSGIEQISITGNFSNIEIAGNRFTNWANTFAVELWDNDATDIGRDSWVHDNVFEGSSTLATNDSGLRIAGQDADFILVVEQGLVSTNNRFHHLGGVNIEAAAAAILTGDTVDGLQRQAVLGTGSVAITGMNVTGWTGVTSLSNRYSAFTFHGAALMNGVGTQIIGGKNLVEHLGGSLLSISNSFLAGQGGDDIVTGTASATSSTTTVHEASKSWTVNEWADGYELVVAASGGGCGLTVPAHRWITSNTSNTLGFAPALPAQADSCTYTITGGGMVVARKPAYVQIANTNFDNASQNYISPDYDQVVIYDATNPGMNTITGNVFSGVHPTGQAAIRLVSSEANTVDYATGTASTGSSTTNITPSVAPSWSVDMHAGRWAELTGGSCAAGAAGTKRRITSNTSTALTTAAFAGSTNGCAFAVRGYDFGATTISANTFAVQCPSAVCGVYGCIEYDRQVSGGGTFRGQVIADSNSFADSAAGVPWCRPIDGWDDTYGDPGVAPWRLSGVCLGGASSTMYLGDGCDATEADAQFTVTGRGFELVGLRSMADSGSGTVVTVRKNGSDVAFTCTEGAGTACTDVVGSVRFNNGDTGSIKIVAPGSGGCNTSTGIGCRHDIKLSLLP